MALTRRDFIRGTGVAAAGAAVAAATPFKSFATALPATTAARAPVLGADLDRFIEGKMKVAHLLGLSAAVIRDGETLWAKGYGWADREAGLRTDTHTVFMLASVSKTFTCEAIMSLVEDGALDLDADINGYLSFPVRNPAFPNRLITLRMILTHTSSIRDYNVWGGAYSNPTLYFHGDSPIALGDFVESYIVPGGSYYVDGKCFYGYAPGGDYNYSNIAVALAGFVAESVIGFSFGDYVRNRMLNPLGLDQSGFHLSDIGTPNIAMPYKHSNATGAYTPLFQYGYPDYPDGEMRMSALHLATWLQTFVNFGEHDNVRILKASTVREIRRPQIPNIALSQGLIWYYGQPENGRFTIMGHNGGDIGVSTDMWFRMKDGAGVVLLANGSPWSWREWFAWRDIRTHLFSLI
jgi:CubicO group peptidase (beta-lactamase class C family)